MSSGFPEFRGWDREVVPCEKCGNESFERKAFGWCSECRKNYRSEYQQARRAYVLGHSEQFLEEMSVPPAYQHCTFANFDAVTSEQKTLLRRISELSTDETLGLYLSGPVGTGKTHLAVATLLRLRAEGYRGRFLSAQELVTACRNTFRGDKSVGDILEDYRGVAVLLLDDLGTEKPSEFSRETLGMLIDRAYRDCQQLIVTSNLDLKELSRSLGARSADRLIELCQAVRVPGSSYRQKRAAQRSAVMRMGLATERVQ